MLTFLKEVVWLSNSGIILKNRKRNKKFRFFISSDNISSMRSYLQNFIEIKIEVLIIIKRIKIDFSGNRNDK